MSQQSLPRMTGAPSAPAAIHSRRGYWKTVYQYFRDQGIPAELLQNACINRAEAEQISSIIKKTQPRTILEVGTYIGVSSGVIALARPPESLFVFVDPNLPVEVLSARFNYAEKRGALVFVQQMLKHFGQDQRTIVLQGFFSHLSMWARENILAFGGDPEEAVIIGERVGEYAPYDLAFIDGEHHTDSVFRDLSLLCPYMTQSGIIVLHDVSGYWGDQVREGIAQFIQAHPAFSLKTDQNLGFLSKDAEKPWFVRQKPPSIMTRVKWRMAYLRRPK